MLELASNAAVAGGSDGDGSAAARVSVPELMQQLQVTQNELENIKVITTLACLLGFLAKLVCDFLGSFGYDM